MSHIQPQPHPTAGVIPNKSNDMNGRYAPELVDNTGKSTYVSSENERNEVPVLGNEVLEHDAQTKGRWFQYLKTKQFWITLLLGQGTSSSYYKYSGSY
jgi:solute carrier family 35 protein F1/2